MSLELGVQGEEWKMARHRSVSAKQQRQAKGLAVLAFLGLVAAGPALATAAADTGDTSSTASEAPNADGPKKVKSGPGHRPSAGANDDADGAPAAPATDGHGDEDADAQQGDNDQPDTDVDTDPEPVDTSQRDDDAQLIESDPQPGAADTGTGEPDESQSLPTEPEPQPEHAQALQTADVTVGDEKSAWDWLPEYPDIQGVTKTEVAAVVFIAATAATVVSIPTAPLLTIPLLLVTMAAWARFEDLGTNHHAPTASAGTPTRLLGVVSGGLSGADEDGDPVKFTVESGPANGSVQIVGNDILGYRYIYTADNPFTVGAINDSFTVKFDDFGGWRNRPLGMHSDLLAITVSDSGLANAGPIVLPVSAGLPDRAGVVRGGVLATDPEGGPLTYRLANGQQSLVTSRGGIVHLDGENYLYIPPTSGGVLNVILDSFDITVTDADDATATITVGIATTELDFGFTGVFDENANTVTGEIDAPADDVALFTYALGAGPGRGAVAVDPVSGAYVYAATGAAQDDSFTVVGTDAFGNQVTFAVAVTPAGVNHDPLVVPVGVGIPDIVSGVVTGGVLGTDIDNDTLHYSVQGYGGGQAVVLGNGALVLVESDGKWTYIPPRDGGGLLGIVDDSFTIYVTDGRGGQASTVIGILTHDLSIDVDTAVSNGTVTGGLNLPAALIGKLTFGLGGQPPAKGDVTVDPAGTFTYVATTAGPGDVDSFSIVATAHGQSIVIAEVAVTAIPANRGPEADALGGGLGTGVLTGKIDASDPDGDTLTWHVGSVGAGNSVLRPNGSIFQIDASGNWKYIPTTEGDPLLGTVGDTFTVYVTDGKGGTASTFVTIGTTELNIGYSNSASEGSVTGGLSIPSSLSGVFAGYSLGQGAPAGVTVNPDGTYDYTGASAASFSIVGTDVYGTSMTVANVTVTPVAPNRAPTLDTKGINITPLAGKTETWTGVTVWDADGDSVTWSASASNGTVSFSTPVDSADVFRGGKISSRTVTYKSNGGSDGVVFPPKLPSNGPADTITITVTDAKGKSLTFTLSYPA